MWEINYRGMAQWGSPSAARAALGATARAGTGLHQLGVLPPWECISGGDFLRLRLQEVIKRLIGGCRLPRDGEGLVRGQVRVLAALSLPLAARDGSWDCPCPPCAPWGDAASSERDGGRQGCPLSPHALRWPVARGGPRSSSAVPAGLGAGVEASPELPAGCPQLVHRILLALQPLRQRPHRLALQD